MYAIPSAPGDCDGGLRPERRRPNLTLIGCNYGANRLIKWSRLDRGANSEIYRCIRAVARELADRLIAARSREKNGHTDGSSERKRERERGREGWKRGRERQREKKEDAEGEEDSEGEEGDDLPRLV